MRAVHYQDLRDDFNESSSFIDPLEDGAKCERDIPYLKQLGINTVFISYVQAQSPHSACMTKLQKAEIYVLVNLGSTIGDIYTTARWDYPLYQRYTAVISSLASYSNVLGFWLMPTSAPLALPHARAAARDLRQFLESSGFRRIPIGSGGFAAVRTPNFEYLSCGENTPIDFLLYVIDIPTMKPKMCPEYISRVRQGLNDLVSVQSQLPILFISHACDVAEFARSGLLQDSYNDNYTALHSGTMMFPYFDAQDDRGILPGEYYLEEHVFKEQWLEDQ